MPFFTEPIINRLMRDPRIREKYKNYKLLNVAQTYRHMNEGIGLSRNVGTRKNVRSVYQREEVRLLRIEETVGSIVSELFTLTQKMCPTVNPKYVFGVLLEALSADTTYDLIIITKPTQKENQKRSASAGGTMRAIDYHKQNRDQKLAKVVGFLIAQKGECPKYPDAYAVRLICTRERGLSALLLGAYMYAIKETPGADPKGLLELSMGYSNNSGYCAYKKMGFDLDFDIITGDCLKPEIEMLPMSVNLAAMELEEIVDRIVKPFHSTEPICDRRFSKDPQKVESVELELLRSKTKKMYQLHFAFSMAYHLGIEKALPLIVEILTEKVYLIMLIQLIRNIKMMLAIKTETLSTMPAMQTLLPLLTSIIGWGNQTMKDGPLVSDREFPPSANVIEDIKQLHRLYPPGMPKKNVLLLLLMFHTDETFRSYLEEYEEQAQAQAQAHSPKTPRGTPPINVSPKTPPGSPPK